MPRLAPLLVLAGLTALATAQQGVEIQTFPTMSVADGRSTVTVTATLREQDGRVVPDGTRVAFTVTGGGTFRDPIVATVGGVARATLVAPSSPGTSKITATSLTGASVPNVFEFEFVADRSLLSSAQEYVEIVASGSMTYTADTKVVEASGLKGGVSVRYRDLSLTADDVQYDIPNGVLRARKARLKFGAVDKEFGELQFKLVGRRGVGTTTYRARRIQTMAWFGHGFQFMSEGKDGKYVLATEEAERYGVVEIKSDGVKPVAIPIGSDVFAFRDLSDSPSTIRAKKAIVFPRKGIQFQRADVYVGETRVMSLPLYELALYGNPSPIVTDQFVQVRNTQLAVNYPRYLSIKPGQTSLLRLRTGDALGRSVAASRGVFLDYELNWNRGDEWDGGLTFGGIGRNDWTMNLRQFWQKDPNTQISASLSMPAGNSVFGSASVNRTFSGFAANLNANLGRSLRGLEFSSQDYSLSVERDPAKVGRLPLRWVVGATAMESRNSLVDGAVSGSGVYSRLQSLPLQLGKRSNLSTALTARQLSGNGPGTGLTWFGTATLSHQLSNAASVVTMYEYTKDGFNDRITGSHRLSLNGFYQSGRTNFNVLASKSLDADRDSLFADFGYRLSSQWRVASTYTWDHFLDNRFLDTTYSLNYRLGWREIGLTWSRLTKRFGIQILGATVY